MFPKYFSLENNCIFITVAYAYPLLRFCRPKVMKNGIEGAMELHLLALVGFGRIGQSSPQLFLSYTTSTFTTYGMNTESTCNWQSRE
jgi:hypothetical protein